MTKRLAIGVCVIAGLTIGTSADQAPPPLSRIMKGKLAHSQAILGAVVTSNWAVLDKESRALALVVRDPLLVRTCPQRPMSALIYVSLDIRFR